MSNKANMIPIPGRLHSVAEGEPVCGSDEVLYERYDHTYTLRLKCNPGGLYTKFRLKSLVIAPY